MYNIYIYLRRLHNNNTSNTPKCSPVWLLEGRGFCIRISQVIRGTSAPKTENQQLTTVE